MKRVSLNKLAEELGLSKTTISLVLNGQGDKHKINSKTQERILNLARHYNYRPNQIARNLITGKTMTLGLIVPNIRDTFYSTTAYYFEDKASEKNYKVLLGSSRENAQKELDLLQTFEDQRVDGLLIASTQYNLPLIQRMYNSGLPIVLFDRAYPDTSLPIVHLDNYAGMQMLVAHMHKRKRKKLGYIGIDLDLSPLHERQRGYTETYQASFQQEAFLHIISYRNYEQECIQAIDEMIDQEIDAILFETHYLALHGIRRINERGLQMPKDILIASFGDHEVFSIFRPQVTAINFQVKHMVESAIGMLFELMENDKPTKGLVKVIPPKLLIRD